MKNLQLVDDGGFVKRYHTQHTIHQQTVGHHSFNVAWICEFITAGAASRNLLMAALQHDIAEFHVGDVPAPTKRRVTEVKELFDAIENEVLIEHGHPDYVSMLTDEEKAILKVADCLEGMLFCLRELKMGNLHAETAYHNFQNYAASRIANELPFRFHDRADRIYDFIFEERSKLP